MREPPGELRRLYAEERDLGFRREFKIFTTEVTEGHGENARILLMHVAVAAGFLPGVGGAA